MKVSNLADVGQMRRRRGISMKIMRNELALRRVSLGFCGSRIDDSQAKSSKKDHDANVE
jgi:hypothetical protein